MKLKKQTFLSSIWIRLGGKKGILITLSECDSWPSQLKEEKKQQTRVLYNNSSEKLK